MISDILRDRSDFRRQPLIIYLLMAVPFPPFWLVPLALTQIWGHAGVEPYASHHRSQIAHIAYGLIAATAFAVVSRIPIVNLFLGMTILVLAIWHYGRLLWGGRALVRHKEVRDPRGIIPGLLPGFL